MEEKKIHLRGVYSLRCAGYLMYICGINLVQVRPMKENPRRNIFFFLDNDETSKGIESYINSKK